MNYDIARWYPRLALLFLLFWQQLPLHSQNALDLRVSCNCAQMTLAEALIQLETDYPLRFFYKADLLPSDRLNLQIEDQPLALALNQLLQGSGLNFQPYDGPNIVILPEALVRESFSANYYRALEASETEPEPAKEDRIVTIGSVSSMSPTGSSKLTGQILGEDNAEPVIGATILVLGTSMGTVTDAFGNYELEVPVGTHELEVKYVGYQNLYRTVQVYSDGTLDLQIEPGAFDLEEVTVRAQAADASVENVQIGVATLDMKNIRKVPALLGEADVVQNLLLNPGVSSIGEGATGFNVRGGEVDQNLILQDDGFFFNASHALGFFSTFNADLIQNVDLYKGNIPAYFGGRIASVLDVEMKDGNFDQFKLQGGIGPVSSRLSLEGPIVKEKVSFIGGVRSSYSDWILRRVNVQEVSNSSAFFYDANFRITVKANEKNTLIFSAYASEDDFTYNNEFGFDYSTLMGQFIYKRIFSDKVYNRLSFAASDYQSAQTDLLGSDAARVETGVQYLRLKNQLTLSLNSQLQVDAGFSSILYQVNPGRQTPSGDISDIREEALEDDRALESALFADVEFRVSPALTILAGVRGVLYQYLGPQEVFEYEDPDRPTLGSGAGSTLYGSGETIATYNSLEPRFSLRYRFTEASSVKLGYSRTAQFINQIFNSDSPTPNSQWQVSTNYIQPFRSHNVSLGYFRNFKDNLWETSLEVYGRYVDELFDFVDFADLIVNPQLETELVSGEGRSYGVELSIKKKSGKLNGWLSYTLSRSERQVAEINQGEWYPSNFDKPHNGSLILNYQPNRRNTLTINFTYSTGRPTTPPVGNYITNAGLVVPIYAERNQFRIPDYHRLDVAYTIGKGYKKDKVLQTSWTLSVYNVYARRNAFSVFFTQAAFRKPQANKLAVLGAAIPSLTLNIEIL